MEIGYIGLTLSLTRIEG